jgi:hypothetical protein
VRIAEENLKRKKLATLVLSLKGENLAAAAASFTDDDNVFLQAALYRWGPRRHHHLLLLVIIFVRPAPFTTPARARESTTSPDLFSVSSNKKNKTKTFP